MDPSAETNSRSYICREKLSWSQTTLDSRLRHVACLWQADTPHQIGKTWIAVKVVEIGVYRQVYQSIVMFPIGGEQVSERTIFLS